MISVNAMLKCLRLQVDSRFIPSLMMVLLLTGLVFSCTLFKTKKTDRLSASDKIQLGMAFKNPQIIGEGTDFLTVKCDIARSLSNRFNLYAVVLDENMRPLRKVSGFTYDPEIPQKDHLWFFFFLYDPAKRYRSPRKSQYIRFAVVEMQEIGMTHVVKISKTWGSKGAAKISDLPAPPDHIAGYLLLDDYRFLAQGDLRKPGGYYVEGTIHGKDGRWTHFTPTSNILGEVDAAMKNILPVDSGWLELKTGRSHSMKDAVSPTAPYVKGWWDGKGYFHPRPPKIFGLK